MRIQMEMNLLGFAIFFLRFYRKEKDSIYQNRFTSFNFLGPFLFNCIASFSQVSFLPVYVQRRFINFFLKNFFKSTLEKCSFSLVKMIVSRAALGTLKLLHRFTLRFNIFRVANIAVNDLSRNITMLKFTEPGLFRIYFTSMLKS